MGLGVDGAVVGEGDGKARVVAVELPAGRAKTVWAFLMNSSFPVDKEN